MSETIAAPTEPSQQQPATPPAAFHPVDVLLHVIATFLAPMFLTASGGDITFARMAALETVNAYRVRSLADLIPIAQVIGFGLAALGSLSLSMADDLPLAMTLRLRGNANACDRSAERNRRALRESPATQVAPLQTPTAPDPDAERYEAELIARVAATQQRARAIQAHMEAAAPAPDQTTHPAPAAPRSTPESPACATESPAAAAPATPPAAIRTPDAAPAPVAAPTRSAASSPEAAPMMTEQQRKAMWGRAMADVAAEFTAELPRLSPAARRDAMRQANALSACANHLLSGNEPSRPRPRDPASDRRQT